MGPQFLNSFRRLPSRVLHRVVQWRHQREFRAQRFSHLNERSIEYRYTLEALAKSATRSILDVGPGSSPFPALLRTCGYHVTAIDPQDDYWAGTFENWSYFILRSAIQDFESLQSHYDSVICVSTLEHIPDYVSALEKMTMLLRPGGLLILTFPYSHQAYIPNVYKLPGTNASPSITFITQAFCEEQLDAWRKNLGLRIESSEYWRCYTGAAWCQGDRLPPQSRRIATPNEAQLICIAAIKE